MSLPCGDPPDGGWPILLFMNGTGGFASASIPYFGYPDRPRPYVVAVIAPLYGGDRSRIPGVSGTENDFFNYSNRLAGRTNQLQQAADMIYLRRAAEGLVFAGGNLADGRTGLTVQLDTGHFGSATNPRLGGSFLESFAEGRTPLVDPGSLMKDDLAGCAGRFAPLPADGP